MGVSVSETPAETRIVTANVTANSRNSRPTMSPINSSGISTAISETVSDTIVNPIWPAPFNAASKGESPASRYRSGSQQVLAQGEGIFRVAGEFAELEARHQAG